MAPATLTDEDFADTSATLTDADFGDAPEVDRPGMGDLKMAEAADERGQLQRERMAMAGIQLQQTAFGPGSIVGANVAFAQAMEPQNAAPVAGALAGAVPQPKGDIRSLPAWDPLRIAAAKSLSDMQQLEREANQTPLITIPKPQSEGLAGVKNVLTAAEGFTTGENVEMGVLGAALAPLGLARAVSAYFTATMGKAALDEVAPVIGDVDALIRDPLGADLPAMSERMATLGVSGLFATQTGKHAYGEMRVPGQTGREQAAGAMVQPMRDKIVPFLDAEASQTAREMRGNITSADIDAALAEVLNEPQPKEVKPSENEAKVQADEGQGRKTLLEQPPVEDAPAVVKPDVQDITRPIEEQPKGAEPTSEQTKDQGVQTLPPPDEPVPKTEVAAPAAPVPAAGAGTASGLPEGFVSVGASTGADIPKPGKIGGYNADVEARQKARGQTPTMSEARKEDPVTFENAMEAIEKDPTAPEKLVEQILDKEKPKGPLTDEEQQMLTWRRADLENRMAQEAARAVDQNLSPEEQAAHQSNAELLERQLLRAEEANRKAGTASGRSLRSRQLEMNDDFTFAGLMMRQRKMTGEVVPPDVRAKIKAQAEEIAALRKEAENTAAIKAEAEQNAQAAATHEAHIKELEKELGSRPRYGQPVLDRAEKIVAALEKKAIEADKYIRNALGRTSAVVDPVLLYHVGVKLAAKIGRFGLEKADAFAAMVTEYGEGIKPHLEAAWKKAHNIISGSGGGDARKVVEKGVSKPMKGGKTKEQLDAQMKADAVAGELTRKTVYDIADSLLRSGVRGTETLMTAVHERVKEFMPEATERDVYRAYSEYGKRTYPSKDAIKIEHARAYREAKLIEDIARLEKDNLDPEKKGFQRGKPDLKQRELMAKRAELQKLRPPSDDPAALAGVQEKRQSAVKNRIEQLDKMLKTGEKPPKGSKVPDDVFTEQLKAERDAMQRKWDELEDAKNPPPPEHEVELKKLQDRADILRDRLARMELTQPKAEGKPTADTAEIAAAKAEIKTLTETMAELRKDAKPKTPEHIRELQRIQGRLDVAKDRLARGELSAPKAQGRPTADTVEIAAAKAELKAVNDTIAELRKPIPLSPAQKALDAALVARERASQTLDDISTGKTKPAALTKEALTQLEEDVRLETEALKQLAAEMRRDAKPKTDPEYAKEQAQIKALETAIARYADRTARVDFSSSPKVLGPDTARVSALKNIRDSRKAAYEAAKRAGKPVLTPEQRYNATRAKGIERQIKDAEARLKAGNFAPRPKKVPPALTKANLDAAAKLEAMKSEIRRGEERYRLENRTKMRKIWDGIRQTNLARTNIISSLDLSAPRQGFVYLLTSSTRIATNPGMILRPFAKMFQAFSSQKLSDRINQEIKARPNRKNGVDKESGVQFQDPDNTSFTRGEENAHSVLDEWAQQSFKGATPLRTVGKAVPLAAAKAVHMSNRAFVTFLNAARAELLDHLLKVNFKDRPPTATELKLVGDMVNLSTGRGNMRHKASTAISLAGLWSPHLLVSRIQLLVGQPLVGSIARGEGRAAKIVTKEYARIIAAGFILYQASRMFSSDKEKKSTSSDFGKTILEGEGGDTRVDPWSGFQQVTVLEERFRKRESTSIDGKTRKLPGRELLLTGAKFYRSKLRPDVGLVADILLGENYKGDKTTAATVAKSLVPIPISMSELLPLIRAHGLSEAAALQAIQMFGVGVSNYADDEGTDKPRPR